MKEKRGVKEVSINPHGKFSNKAWTLDPWLSVYFTKRLSLIAFYTDRVECFMGFYLVITCLLSVCFHFKLVRLRIE